MSLLPPTLPYAPQDPRRGLGAVFHVGIFLWSLALIVIWLLIMVFVVPRFIEIFMDFKIAVPAPTRLLFAAHKLVLYGGFAVLLLVPFVLGFVSGPMTRGGRRAVRMLVTLLFGLLVGFTILGLAQPMMTLIEGMTTSQKK